MAWALQINRHLDSNTPNNSKGDVEVGIKDIVFYAVLYPFLYVVDGFDRDQML